MPTDRALMPPRGPEGDPTEPVVGPNLLLGLGAVQLRNTQREWAGWLICGRGGDSLTLVELRSGNVDLSVERVELILHLGQPRGEQKNDVDLSGWRGLARRPDGAARRCAVSGS